MKLLYKPFMTLHLMVHGYEVVYRINSIKLYKCKLQEWLSWKIATLH